MLNHTNSTFVIEYIVAGKIKETIGINNPMSRALCLWTKGKLEKTTHRAGLLLIQPADKYCKTKLKSWK